MGTLGTRARNGKKPASRVNEAYKQKYVAAARELKESAEERAATAEILRIISTSPANLERVFEAITAAGKRLMPDMRVALLLVRDGKLHYASHSGVTAERRAVVSKYFPLPLDRKSVVGTATVDKRVMVVPDIDAERRRYPRSLMTSRISGARAMLAVPLLRDKTAIGALAVTRTTPGTFSDKQIALAQAFAAQAGIALENARLFNETKEALERQTATAEILRVIAASPGDSQPVFDAIANAAKKLFAARYAVVARCVGDELHLAAHTMSGKREDASLRRFFPSRITGQGALGKAVLTGKPAAIEDVETDPVYSEDFRRGARERGFRSLLAVPMIRDGVAIGAITVSRSEPGSFSDRQIDLLETFAEQAAIAIENARLFNETKEALEQQTATADILKVISRSPAEVQPVFEAIVQSGRYLFPGAAIGVVIPEDGKVHLRAMAGANAERRRSSFPVPLSPEYITAAAILECRVIDIPDFRKPPARFSVGAKHAVSFGYQAATVMPMVRGGTAVGAVSVVRDAPGPLSEREISLLQTFAEQAAIAIENARLFNETKEALERQTATADILRVIASTPTDTHPVFDAIVNAASRLIRGKRTGLLLRRGDHFIAVANSGERIIEDLPADVRTVPLDPDHNFPSRVILNREVLHISDWLGDEVPEFEKGVAKAWGIRSGVMVPLVRGGEGIGALAVTRDKIDIYHQKEIELLRSFADQAVIAIENARLFNETKEALEQQTASADILKVISASPTSVEPVFQAIARNAVRLCDAVFCNVLRLDGELLHVAAHHGFDQSFIERLHSIYPMKPDASQISGRVIAQKAVVHIEDATVDERYDRDYAAAGGWRRMLGVPMMREARPLGVIVVAWKDVGKTPEDQVRLLQTFADQAAIAIDNVRLFNETKEALERQTATAEILKVISSSPTDVQPVLEAIIQTAVRLFAPRSGAMLMRDGDKMVLGPMAGPLASDPRKLEQVRSAYSVLPLDASQLLTARAIVDASVTEIRDTEALDTPAAGRQAARILGYRSQTNVPLIRAGVGIGVILLVHPEPDQSLTPKELELVRTFADQAVIAIENARLFNETKEALEQQTATTEILRVISDSPTSTQPVFQAIAERAARICDASDARIHLLDGANLRLVAGFGDVPAPELGTLRAVERGLAIGRAVLEGKPVHVDDVLAVAKEFPTASKYGAQFGWRTVLAVPLIREGRALGAISLRRPEVRPFDDNQIALLKTFADQAAIAIENVRLFNETKEALERQTATAEILKVISSSPTDVQPVFDAVAQRAAQLCNAAQASVFMAEGDVLRRVAAVGQPSPVKELPIVRGLIYGRAFLDCRAVHVEDLLTVLDEYPDARENQRNTGFRTLLAVPMLRDGKAIGTIGAWHREVKPFSREQIELLETFAAQAVIAIENVRLFNETKEALERQTATADILGVIAASPSDVQPVFEAIVRHAGRLAAGSSVNVSRVVRDEVHLAAYTRVSETSDELLKGLYPFRIGSSYAMEQAVTTRAPTFIADFETDPRITNQSRAVMRARGFRSTLYVPIVQGDVVHGLMHVSKVEPGPFPQKWIDLLKTFADQAAIAIENVRLFNATQEALEQQTATTEVLNVISSSITDARPVFDAIARSVLKLYGARNVGLVVRAGETIDRVGYAVSESSADDGTQALYPIPLDEHSLSGRAILRGEVIHIRDVETEEGLSEHSRAITRKTGARSVLIAPMYSMGTATGALAVARRSPGGFSDREVEMIRTFADQAVIAMENVRLFREIEEKSKQLEEASEHKSQFLASMSHELRTPLNALLGFNEMILGDIYGEVPGDMRPPLLQMQASGKHLLRLINNVLDLAKIEAGRMELALADYSVHEVVESVRSTLRPLAQEKGLDFVAELAADLPLARGDAGRITQCLMNLAGNSLKFTKTGKVQISVAADNGLLRYRVADTGIGIPSDKINGLFTEFKQTDATVASEYGGTGLGLAISKKFVEMHGGRIWVESEPGRGSVFTFEVPLRAAAQ